LFPTVLLLLGLPASALYEAIFLATLSTCVVPLPEESALLAAGYAARIGSVHLGGAVLAAWAAVMVGDTLGYAIGRFFLASLLHTRAGRRILPDAWRIWAEQFAARHGDRAVFLARFLVGVRGFVYFAIGAARHSFLRFLAVNAAAAVVEVGALVALGFALGELREVHGPWEGGGSIANLGSAARAVDVAVAIVLVLTLFGPALVKKTQPSSSGADGR
jgi:membrane protein DedA with SNARE-associated domain